MKTYIVIGGLAHSLDDDIVCYVTGRDGLGEAPLHRLEERGPGQHGASDVGFRLDPRTVTLALDIVGDTGADLQARRNALLGWLRPTNAPRILRFVLDDGTTRQLDVHSRGLLTLPTAARRGHVIQAAAQFRAPDPTFYDPVAQVATFALGGGGTGMPVPLLVPLTVGASAISESRTILYTGSWRALPVVRITGPIQDCVVTNQSTGETLDLTGVTIAEGDWYEIDLRYGRKTVVDAAGANRIADLTEDSDLATWHLAADDEVPDGVNAITVTGSGLDAGTRIDITYQPRYTGI
jgi:hypothetical protein